MTINEIINKVNKTDYWDARVKEVTCNYFGDEINIRYEGNVDDVYLTFRGCYSINFNHEKSYSKIQAVRDMSILQIPYFLQDIDITEIREESENFLVCQINMFPLFLEIWCKEIVVEQI